MSLSEKEQMRNSIKEYAALKPVRVPTRGLRSPLSLHIMWQHKLASVTLMLALFFTSGAGAVYASTSSLPGDKLYKVKIVVENLHERVLFSDVARAELAERLTERREKETQRLQELGKLDEVRIAMINKRVAKHQASAELVLAKLEVTTPQRAARIRAKLADKSVHIRSITNQSLAPYFKRLMLQIESDYDAQTKELTELEQEILELDESY